MNMNLPAVVTPPSIYRGCSTWMTFWEENFTPGDFTPVNIKICVVVILGNTGRSRMVIIKSPWTYIWNLVVWTWLKSHLQSQNNIWEYQERSLLPIWVSRPLEDKIKIKRQVMPLLMLVWRIFQILLRSFKSCLMRVMLVRCPNMNPLTVTLSINTDL